MNLIEEYVAVIIFALALLICRIFDLKKWINQFKK